MQGTKLRKIIKSTAQNFPFGKQLVLLLLLSAQASFVTAVNAAADDCAAADGYGFVCGPENAEDLVLVPDTSWIIASGDLKEAALYLISATDKSWSGLYPGNGSSNRHNSTAWPSCPGAPDPENFVTHGLNLRPGANGHATLYAVSHGGREAIEVFDIDSTGSRPVLEWQGCVPMPEGLAANSVASFADGSIVATVLIHPGKEFRDLIAGEPTGGVYEWTPGAAAFTFIEGTELPGNNGIEVAADGSELYVVSSGLHTVVAFSHSNPARQLRTTRELSFTPDNVHRDSQGRLITAGMLNDDPVCGNMANPDTFDLALVAQCPRPFIARYIDPATMQDTALADGPATPTFSNATMALPVGNEVWIGSFSSQRVGYRPLK